MYTYILTAKSKGSYVFDHDFYEGFSAVGYYK